MARLDCWMYILAKKELYVILMQTQYKAYPLERHLKAVVEVFEVFDGPVGRGPCLWRHLFFLCFW